MGAFGRILGLLGVEASERAIFSWAALCLALQGAAAYALINFAESLFLKRVGVEHLPLVLLGSSVLLVGTTAGLGRLAGGGDRSRWLPPTMLALAAAVLPFLVVGPAAPAVPLALLVLLARQVLALGELVVWLALGDLVTPRQAKRLFAPLTGGLTVGCILGSFGSHPLAQAIGSEGLLLACALALAAAGGAGARLRASRPRRLEQVRLGPSERAGGSSAPGLASLWQQSLLFRLLALAVVAGGLLGPVLYFEFSSAADLATAGPGGEARLLALYAQVRGWLAVAILVTQLGVSSRLYHAIGLPLSLATWPATYLLGFGWLGLRFGLPAGIGSLSLTRVAEDGLGAGAMRVLYNLFPESLRAHVSSLLEGPLERLGGAAGNAMVLGLLALGLQGWIPGLALGLAAAWLTAALRLWRAYPSLLLGAASQHRLAESDAERASLLDAGTVRALAPSLVDPDPRVCRTAIDLVRDADPALAAGLLAEATAASPPGTRPLLVDALHRLVEPRAPGELYGDEAAAALERLLAEPRALPVEQRADLVQTYARLTGGAALPEAIRERSLRVLERALGDREAPVRLAAIAELHRRRRPPPGVGDLDQTLDQVLRGRDAVVRRIARQELRAMLLCDAPDARWQQRLALLSGRLEHRADRAEAAETLAAVARQHPDHAEPCDPAMRARAEDADPRVRAAALTYLAERGGSEAPERLVGALDARHPAEARAAREGLVRLGAEAVPSLLREIEFGTPSRRSATLSVLGELELDAEALGQLYVRELESVRQVAVLRGALDDEAPPLLVRRLEERVGEGLGTLLALLAVLRGDPRISSLDRSLRRAREERERDILVEALEALLDPQARAALVPLLEDGDPARRGARAAERLGRRVPSPAHARVELARDADPLTRELAARSTPLESPAPVGESFAAPVGDSSAAAVHREATLVLDPMDVAVRLGDVAPFDRLSTHQLMRMAASLREERVDAGDSVFEEGDEGTALYLVLEGRVALSRGGEALEEVAAGAFFGLPAALDGVPRNLAARAREPLLLLRLERALLLELMEESPALAIGLGQHLSRQVRELQERLGGGEA